jgi:hypothetical protein
MDVIDNIQGRAVIVEHVPLPIGLRFNTRPLLLKFILEPLVA